jgi:hypothetical protein
MAGLKLVSGQTVFMSVCVGGVGFEQAKSPRQGGQESAGKP